MAEARENTTSFRGINLDLHTHVSAAVNAGIALERILAHEGIPMAIWERADEAWQDALADSADDDMQLIEQWDGALVQASRRFSRRIRPIDEDLDAWIAFSNHVQQSNDVFATLEAQGLTTADWLSLQTLWMERFAADPELRRRAAERLATGNGALPALQIDPIVLPPPRTRDVSSSESLGSQAQTRPGPDPDNDDGDDEDEDDSDEQPTRPIPEFEVPSAAVRSTPSSPAPAGSLGPEQLDPEQLGPEQGSVPEYLRSSPGASRPSGPYPDGIGVAPAAAPALGESEPSCTPGAPPKADAASSWTSSAAFAAPVATAPSSLTPPAATAPSSLTPPAATAPSSLTPPAATAPSSLTPPAANPEAVDADAAGPLKQLKKLPWET